MKEKAIFLNSGGPDSLAALLAMKNKYELYSLYIDTHQPNRNRAMSVAKRMAEKYCVNHHIIDLGLLCADEYTWFNDKWKVPEKTTNHIIGIPFQGAVFFSISAAYAVINNCFTVITGCKVKVKAREQTDMFNQAQEMIKMGNHINFIHCGYEHTDEQIAAVVNTEHELKDYTVSCTHEIPCGLCHKCIRKINTLKLKELNYVEKI